MNADNSIRLRDAIVAASVSATAVGKIVPKGRLQNLLCAAVPVYNEIAATEGWPAIPIPAFCSPAPAPSPTPATQAKE